MVKFQSECLCLMVTMFSLNRAALLQLLVMCQVFAGHRVIDHRDILVSRGESVTLTCNTSEEKITQIKWTKDRFIYIYSSSLNKTFSNLTSNRLTIDLNLPAQLNVSNAQHEDAGLYICEVVSGDHGTWTTEWNLTVSEAPERVSSSWDFLYILTSAIGLLCVISAAICLCRKLRTQNQNTSVQDQSDLESAEEVVLRRPQAGPDRRTHNKHRSQYIERLNSIYGQLGH
ncbi:zwei Ig domain protein zig-1-like [Pagrus major]|uniref:zwei Ig domain protein zig-1-like n=1 Tax=Pagrus major TaxID=143350 RepID=UPI003CC85C36